jgi:hypothetical protein
MHKAIWDASEGDFDASDDECVQILEAARRLIRPSSEPATPADMPPDRPCADPSSDQDSRPDGVPPVGPPQDSAVPPSSVVPRKL